MRRHNSLRPQPPLLLLLLVLLTMAVLSCFAILLRGLGHPALSPQSHSFDLSEISTLFHGKANRTLQINSSSSSSSVEDDAPTSTSPLQFPAATLTEKEETTADQLLTGSGSPYHNWQLFAADFQEMMLNLKIFVYPDGFVNESTSYAHIFRPHPNPFHPKLGNYFSEHMFKVALLRSSLITPIPQEAHLFFMPFSINSLRNDPRVHSEASISEFVSQYTAGISRDFPFWNASGGADHFYVFCHSVGREAASKHPDLHNNAIQVTCSSSYFERFFITHKDVGLPQVWPRPHHQALNPPDARHKLVFFAGRIQNSRIRQVLIALWGNDSYMDLFSTSPSFPYEDGFRRSKYCLHVKGYEVNTARISDAIHYGCIPVIISNYYDLPFANVLDWSKFSIIVSQGEIAFLKARLLSISRQVYLSMYHNLCRVRKHFIWHTTPTGYDSFHMIAYQLWLRRGVHRLSY